MPITCLQALLMCLDRKHRLALLLGEVFELTSAEAVGVKCGGSGHVVVEAEVMPRQEAQRLYECAVGRLAPWRVLRATWPSLTVAGGVINYRLLSMCSFHTRAPSSCESTPRKNASPRASWSPALSLERNLGR